MKCSKCDTENKDTSKHCRKCGLGLSQLPIWRPTWAWHAKTLVIIYCVLIIVFFALNHILKPYMRQIPGDITPWMKEMPKQEKTAE